MEIAKQVPYGTRVVDVGTDHALLPVYLVQQGQAVSAVATDVAAGPHRAALENVKKYGLEEKISVRLGDGLTTVTPTEAQVVIIAGMGGSLEAEILAAAPAICQQAKRLILQPMNAVERLRKFLDERGFSLIYEGVVVEDQRFYDLLVAQNVQKPVNTYQNYNHDPDWLNLAYALGPMNLQRPTPAFLQYAHHQVESWRTIARSLGQSVQEEARRKAQDLEARVNLLNHWLDSKDPQENS